MRLQGERGGPPWHGEGKGTLASYRIGELDAIDHDPERTQREREQLAFMRAWARECRRAGRERDWREPIRVWLEAEATAHGLTLEDFRAVAHRRGRMTQGQRERRDILARAVFTLHGISPWAADRVLAAATGKVVTLQTIADVLGTGPQTIANLERRGHELTEQVQKQAAEEAVAAEAARIARQKPCARHKTFQGDCPACLRNAPEEAVEYSGPEQLRGRLVGGSFGRATAYAPLTKDQGPPGCDSDRG